MKKFALLFLITVVSFGFAGCLYDGGNWSKGIRYGDTREATVCGKEIVQVPAPDNPGETQPEYRVQLVWDDVERGTHPMLWSVVGEKTYQVLNDSDRVVITSCNFGQLNGHVTVLYYWSDDRAFEINEFNYEFDLPEDPHPR